MSYVLKRWTVLDHFRGLRDSHLLEDEVINLSCHSNQLIFLHYSKVY